MVQNEPIAEASHTLLQFTISYLTSDTVSTKVSNVNRQPAWYISCTDDDQSPSNAD